MDRRPLVSVVVPTYNRGYCLNQTIASALAQTYDHLEIVVVDDGSTDDTSALLATAQLRDHRVRSLRQENAGVSVARNRGFRECRGEYIALLDSDDIWRPWKLELQVACMERWTVGMSWSDFAAVGPDGEMVHQRYLRRMYSAWSGLMPHDLFVEHHPLASMCRNAPAAVNEHHLHIGDIFSDMVRGNLVHTSTVVMRRDRLERVAGFDETLVGSGEDHDFHLRVCREGPVCFIDTPTMDYRIGLPDALTRDTFSLAKNFLTTVTRAIERDRDRIRLSDAELSAVLGEANLWLGQELLARGENRQAREHLRAAWRHRPWDRRILKPALLSILSPHVCAALSNRGRRATASHP
jgi:glycosyltransferase involved in cell wall biosynthesis